MHVFAALLNPKAKHRLEKFSVSIHDIETGKEELEQMVQDSVLPIGDGDDDDEEHPAKRRKRSVPSMRCLAENSSDDDTDGGNEGPDDCGLVRECTIKTELASYWRHKSHIPHKI
ncbi:hypothetical protein PsorP6_015038 [Peronosclerospora sorghi]|uniref:Uncharacterized protein n=1 Tax=Peronosclerospora sorghi TaxID=230839 RepID=A0ACC0VRM9_9STRA|nr:hypothetical protein PsorP6_015038 [Peronosclerospora sorghi]